MKTSYLALACILIGATPTAFSAQWDATTTYLLKQSSAAYRKLQDSSYTVLEREWSSNDMLCERRAKVVLKGPNSFVDGDFPYFRQVAPGRKVPTRQRVKSVVNEHYSARWAHDAGGAEQFENQAEGSPSQRGLQVINIFRPTDIAILGAGDSSRSIEDLATFIGANTEWTASGPDESGIFILRVTVPAQKHRTLFVFRLDSQFGYLIRRFESYDARGQLSAYTDVKLAKTAEQAAYPAQVERHVIESGRDKVRAKWEFSEYRQSPQIRDDQFTVAALDLPEALPVAVEDAMGASRLFTVRNGAMEPIATVLPAAHAPLSRAKDATASPGDAHSSGSVVKVCVVLLLVSLLAWFVIRRLIDWRRKVTLS